MECLLKRDVAWRDVGLGKEAWLWVIDLDGCACDGGVLPCLDVHRLFLESENASVSLRSAECVRGGPLLGARSFRSERSFTKVVGQSFD